jgi:hypothetical protein
MQCTSPSDVSRGLIDLGLPTGVMDKKTATHTYTAREKIRLQ